MVATRRSTRGGGGNALDETPMPTKKTTTRSTRMVSGAGDSQEEEQQQPPRSTTSKRLISIRKASMTSSSTNKKSSSSSSSSQNKTNNNKWKWGLVIVMALLMALASAGIYHYDQRQQKRARAPRQPWQAPFLYVPLKVRATQAVQAARAKGMAWAMASEKEAHRALRRGKQHMMRVLMAANALGLQGEAKVRAQWHTTPVPACPEMPAMPPTMPMLGDLLRNWPAGNADHQPLKHYGATVCRFDFGNATEQATALRYREAGIPFVLYNVAALDEVVAKWQNRTYFSRLLGVAKYRGEESYSRFLSVATKKVASEEETCGTKTRAAKSQYFADKERAKPYRAKPMRHFEWAAMARDPDRNATSPHAYLRVSDVYNHAMYDDLASLFAEGAPAVLLKEPIPSPRAMNIGQMKLKRSIECTFGMGGAIAEAHYFTQCMTVAGMNGTSRFLLAPPAECANAYLRPLTDPRGRQSQVDWTAPDLEAYPDFAAMKGHEVVLRPGEILSIPSNWLRYQVHLGAETLSCAVTEYKGLPQGLDELHACGFDERKNYYLRE